MEEKKEFCGLFGIYNNKDAAFMTFLGLFSLQHRGEESSGIISFDGNSFYHQRGMGLVTDVFDEQRIKTLPGSQAIGHVRYSTTGSTAIRNIQPLFADSHHLSLALAHNGNLVNSYQLRNSLEKKGAIFHTSSDSEIILHLIMRSKKDNFIDKIIDALAKVKGAYSLVMMNKEGIIGLRDPWGFRPLALGKKDGSFCLASETCAFDLIGAKFVREVEPGEIVYINKNGISSYRLKNKTIKNSFCIFELIYFSRPDSIVFGETVHIVREKFGRKLAQEYPVEADCVIGVPDSGTSAALGFAKESGIPLEIGIIRNHYIGRTFIQPKQSKREWAVKVKFNFLKEVIKNKRIVIIDDSIVRGTTSRNRVKTFRELGAKEVHLRISCPPHRFGCIYGIDFPDRTKLIAYKNTIKEIERFLEVDSLGYLSLEGMLSCLKYPADCYCTACWTGKYPLRGEKNYNKNILERGNCG